MKQYIRIFRQAHFSFAQDQNVLLPSSDFAVGGTAKKIVYQSAKFEKIAQYIARVWQMPRHLCEFYTIFIAMLTVQSEVCRVTDIRFERPHRILCGKSTRNGAHGCGNFNVRVPSHTSQWEMALKIHQLYRAGRRTHLCHRNVPRSLFRIHRCNFQVVCSCRCLPQRNYL